MKLNNNITNSMLIALALFLLLSTVTFAIPNSITLQGKLTNANGVSQVGTFNFTFRIYDAFTYTFGTASTAKLYADGVEVSGSWVAGTGNVAAATNTNGLYIGNILISHETAFNGSIDEVRIYKRALSSEEIRTQYLRGKGFGASGAITADKFRVVNTSASRIFEVNQTGATIAPGGVQRLTIDSSGNVGIGTSLPHNTLTVIGSLDVSGSLNATSINATQRLIINNTLFVNGSRVGIGTASPSRTLEV